MIGKKSKTVLFLGSLSLLLLTTSFAQADPQIPPQLPICGYGQLDNGQYGARCVCGSSVTENNEADMNDWKDRKHTGSGHCRPEVI